MLDVLVFPLDRLSIVVALCPFYMSWSARWLPMKLAPSVIKTLSIGFTVLFASFPFHEMYLHRNRQPPSRGRELEPYK